LEQDTSTDFESEDKIIGFNFTPSDTSHENVDTPEELAYAVEMRQQRLEYLEKVKREKDITLPNQSPLVTRQTTQNATPSLADETMYTTDYQNEEPTGTIQLEPWNPATLQSQSKHSYPLS